MGGRSEYIHIHIYDNGDVYNAYEIYLNSLLIASSYRIMQLETYGRYINIKLCSKI